MIFLFLLRICSQTLSCNFLVIFSDTKEQVWVWNYQNEKLFMDVDESIRFRVVGDYFIDNPPVSKEAILSKFTTANDPSVTFNLPQKSPPFNIVASICEDGLGLVSWWQ